jgi:sporulation protein YabP
MEDLGNIGTRHKVILGNRRTCNISGVNDVLSFDIREILLETEQGMLMIKGDDLHVNRLTLDKGEVDVDGKIDSLTYSDIGNGQPGHAKGESFLSKLFR